MWQRFYLGELALTRKIGETSQRLEEPTRQTGVFYVFVFIPHAIYCFVLNLILNVSIYLT